MPSPEYASSVFINCPYDAHYQPLSDALIFCVHDCGFIARSALELDDGAQVRINKIYDLIAGCRFGIHDLSRTEPDDTTGLPRFNMPLELGIFLGARRYGAATQQDKNLLILDREAHRYLNFISDIRGQDVKAHSGDRETIIRLARNWLRNAVAAEGISVPSGSLIYDRYEEFERDLPAFCAAFNLDPGELIFNDYIQVIEEWLRANPW